MKTNRIEEIKEQLPWWIVSQVEGAIKYYDKKDSISPLERWENALRYQEWNDSGRPMGVR